MGLDLELAQLLEQGGHGWAGGSCDLSSLQREAAWARTRNEG
jgi:hypothetical protein